MERAELLKCLEDAKRRHAESGAIYIESQRMIVASLKARGSDATQAEELLRVFERNQENHLAEIERILDELDKVPLADSDARS